MGKQTRPPENQDVTLSGCPPLINCVSSESVIPLYQVDPVIPSVPEEEVWKALREVIAETPRAEIVDDYPGYLHVRCQTAVFRFVDHLEFSYDHHNHIIDVRSASVLGILDFGVNRMRVSSFKTKLYEKGVVLEP